MTVAPSFFLPSKSYSNLGSTSPRPVKDPFPTHFGRAGKRADDALRVQECLSLSGGCLPAPARRRGRSWIETLIANERLSGRRKGGFYLSISLARRDPERERAIERSDARRKKGIKLNFHRGEGVHARPEGERSHHLKECFPTLGKTQFSLFSILSPRASGRPWPWRLVLAFPPPRG